MSERSERERAAEEARGGRRPQGRAARGTMKALAIVMLLATPAYAGFEDIKGAGALEYEASYVHDAEQDPALAAVDGLGLAGVRMRAQAGPGAFGWKIGVDLFAGATAPGGFAYDVGVYLFGVGARLGRWSRVGVTGGFGASGATGTVDDAGQFQAEASLELGLGARLRFISRARVAGLVGSTARQDGSPTLPWSDQLDASAAIRLGRRNTEYDFPTGRGYYLGVAYRESEGARMIGVVIGHSIDAATR